MYLQIYSADVVIEGDQEKITKLLSKIGLKNPGVSRVYVDREYGVVGFSPNFEHHSIAILYSMEMAKRLVEEASSKISKEILYDSKSRTCRIIV